MKKLLIGTALFTSVVLGAALVQAEVFDPDTGTVTVMASGGTVYESGTVGPTTVTNAGAVVESVTVPAGRYQIIAKAWIDFSVGTSTFAQCGLVGDGGSDATRLGGGGAVIAVGHATFADETDVEFACITDDEVDAYRIVLSVTTVSAIVAQ